MARSQGKAIRITLLSLITRSILLCIHIYRFVFSWLLPYACRFEPSCSQYAITAIKVNGVIKGSWLTIKRILRCHPWHPGGIDPVHK